MYIFIKFDILKIMLDLTQVKFNQHPDAIKLAIYHPKPIGNQYFLFL
jgi:hypothetical protein